MSRFTIWIVQPPGIPHVRCFVDQATSITSALRSLGHEVVFDPGRQGDITNPLADRNGTFGRLIIFGAHCIPEIPMPHDAIIYNAEQYTVHFSSAYLNMLRRHSVWTYSDFNLQMLTMMGVERAAICRVGYVPELSKIKSAEEDIDVLFVGSMTERRSIALRALAQTKRSNGKSIVVKALFGIYGEELDRWISRAKIVLNIHAGLPAVFEIFRCSYLFANKKCVVSEDGGSDKELESLASRTTMYVPYDKISSACMALIDDVEARAKIAEQGFVEFSKIDQVKEIQLALEKS